MNVDKTQIKATVDGENALVRFIALEVTQPYYVEIVLREIQEVVNQFRVRRLVINFTGVRHLSSAFFGKLIFLNKAVGGKGVRLLLCCMSSDAEHAYKLVNLHKLIPLYATEEEALEG